MSQSVALFYALFHMPFSTYLAAFLIGMGNNSVFSLSGSSKDVKAAGGDGMVITVFLGPLAGWNPPAETRSIARVRDSESMQRAVWRKNPNTFYVAIEKKKGCPLGKKRYRIDWKFTLSVPKGQSALISKF
eukprot:COSAG05_NODE_1065_length_5983_cov_16.815602_3_plen_131_part_00